MSRHVVRIIQSLVLAALVAAPTSAADDKDLKKDLTAVIALQGLPCGEVVDVTTQADNDYLASCKDGNKYRVYMTASGRVVVEKRK